MNRKNRHPEPASERMRPQPTASPAGDPVRQPPAAPTNDPTEAIRTRAYYKWVEAGCPPGDGVGFWLEAEAERAPGQNVGSGI